MLKKIIIVVFIIVGYKFLFDSENLLEKCSDHSFLNYSVGTFFNSNKSKIPVPLKKSDFLGKIITNDDYYNQYSTGGIDKGYTYNDVLYFKVYNELITIDDKRSKRTFEFLNQSYKKKKEVSRNYEKISSICQYESNYNPKTFNKTWENANSLNELRKTIIKMRKKYKK